MTEAIAAESALIVHVAAAEPWVGELRALHDPAARQGVPAHITLLYPFMDPARIDASVRMRIDGVARATPAFAFRLARTGRFPGTLYLAPEPAAPFVALTRALAAAFPEHPPYGGRHPDVIPHLTVAMTEGSGTAEDDPPWQAAEVRLRAALPQPAGIAASCGELLLIGNATGRWRPLQTFTLGPGAS